MTPRRASLILAVLTATSQAQQVFDSVILQAHERELADLNGAIPVVLVQEVRDIVERAAARGGSSVGSVSHRRRVEAFEAYLIGRTKSFACIPQPGVSPSAVLNAVQQAGIDEKLAFTRDDIPGLSARVQRIIQALTPSKWCTLRTLESVR